MFNDILKCSAKLLVVLVFVDFACGLPVDDVVRSETLKDMRKYMNESVEPCDNFYEFTCGNWPKYHPSSQEAIRTNLYEIMSKDFDQKVKNLMKLDDSSDTELEQKVKSFYQSCVKLPEKWGIYIENLKKLADDFGKMPAMEGDNWQEDNFDWQKTVAAIKHQYDIGTIVNTMHTNGLSDASTSVILIAQGYEPLESKLIYFADEHEPIRLRYKEYMAKSMIQYLGISEDVATQTAEDIFAFEVSLAHGEPDENLGLQIEDIFFPTTAEKLQNTYSPVLNMTQLILTELGSIPPYTYYEDRAFLENVVKVMQKTPKKTVANFIYYKLFKEFFFTTPKHTKDQEEECISKVKEHFSNVLENMVYRKYIKNQTHNHLDVMWSDIKLAFEDVLKSPDLHWIHADAKKYAIEKLTAMKLEVPAAKINQKMAQIAELSTIDHEDFLHNMKAIRSAVATNGRNNLYKPSRDTMDSRPNSAFTPSNLIKFNKITVPVSVLQPHYMLSTSLPSAFNFGRLGTLLAHELIHGFDDTGHKFDKVGNKFDWWDSVSADAFNDHVKCFIDQYEQYKFGGQHLPRRIDQGENIADNGGLRLAYKAYLKWNENSARTAEERKQETFPGFPYNNKQLFFISFAQEGCADTYSEYKRVSVATDPHTPTELRAIAAISNLNEFAEVFNCPLGSAMNPVKKCKIY